MQYFVLAITYYYYFKRCCRAGGNVFFCNFVGRSENKSERLGDEGAENDKMFVKAHKGNADNHRLKRKASSEDNV